MERLYKLQGISDTMICVTVFVTVMSLIGLFRMSDWLAVTLFTVTLSSTAIYHYEYLRLKKKGKL